MSVVLWPTLFGLRPCGAANGRALHPVHRSASLVVGNLRVVAITLLIAVSVHADQNLPGNVTVTGGTSTGNLFVTGFVDIDGNSVTFGTQGASYGAGLLYTDSATDTLKFHLNRSTASWLWQHTTVAAMLLDSAHQLILYQADGTTAGLTFLPASNSIKLGTHANGTLTADANGMITAGGGFTVAGNFTNTSGTFTGGSTGLNLNAGGTNQSITLSSSTAGDIIFKTNGLERARINSAGNVGIGMSAPGYKLDISGVVNASDFRGAIGATTPSTGAFTTISATGKLTLDNAATPTLTLDRGATTDYQVIAFKTAGATTGGWEIYGGNTATQDLMFYSYGSAAVVTMKPSAVFFHKALVSAMGNDTNVLYANTATTGYQLISLANTSGQAIFGVQGTSTALGGTGSSNYDTVLRGQAGVSISADGGVTTQVRVSSSGLAVTGSNSVATGLVVDASVIPSINLRRTNDVSGTGNINFLGSANAVSARISYNDTIAGAIEFKIGGTASGNNILSLTTSGAAVMGALSSTTGANFATSSGNVGIGTASPTHKLAVNGTIRAKEVIVDNTNWADYVFEEDYRLAPLAEVEEHIRSRKHLPGIPSAAEIAKEGVSMGDMQAKLLSKVEELTLYLIAQEKRIERLEQENRRLRAQTSTP